GEDTDVFAGELDRKPDQTQSSDTDNIGSITSSNFWGQTFVPAHSLLAAIRVSLGTSGGGGNLTLTIEDSPGGNAIAVASLQYDEVVNGWNTFLFSPPLKVSTGVSYFFFISSDGGSAYTIYGDSTLNPYPDGTAWRYSGSWQEQASLDLAFITCYPVPQLFDLSGGLSPARVTYTGGGGLHRWDPWNAGNWTSNATYQSEYIYEQASANNTMVEKGDRRVTPVPRMGFYNFMDNAGKNATLDENSSVLKENPTPESVTLTFWSTAYGGSDQWNVTGSVSGGQSATLQDHVLYWFDSGVNSGKVGIYLNADPSNYTNGDTMTFDIARTGWYEPYSVVNDSDTDLGASYTELYGCGVTNGTGTESGDWDDKYTEDVYVDVDGSLTVSEGDIRVTEVNIWVDLPAYTGKSLGAVCYSSERGEAFAVGNGFTAFLHEENPPAGRFVDQYQTNATDYLHSVTYTDDYGQTFVPRTRSISAIAVYMIPKPSTQDNITLYLADSVGGTDIASVTLEATEVVDGWNNFTFSSPVNVTPGYSYFFHLKTQSVDGYDIYGSTASLYGDGEAYYYSGGWTADSSGYDVAFKTYSPTLEKRREEQWDTSSVLEYVTTTQKYGQTFTPEEDSIDAIEVYLSLSAPATPVSLSIAEYPGGDPLATTSLDPGSLQTGWNLFNFSESVSVDAGFEYFFWLESGETSSTVGVSGVTLDIYTGGQGWYDDGTGWSGRASEDMAFCIWSSSPLDQFSPDITTSEALNNGNAQAQTFVPTGELLYNVYFYIEKEVPLPSYGITLSIKEGNPDGTGNILANIIKAPDEIDDGWNPFIFPTPVYLTPGITYSLILGTKASGGYAYRIYYDGDSYPGGMRWTYSGAIWSSYNTEDLAFYTFINGTRYWKDAGIGNGHDYEDFYDVAYASNASSYIVVGYNTSSGNGLIYQYDPENDTWIDRSTSLVMGVNLTGIAWHPTENYGLITGNESGKGKLFRLNGAPSWALAEVEIGGIYSFNSTLTAVAWNHNGSQAVITAENGGILEFSNSTGKCTIRYGSSTEYAGYAITLYAICMKPPASPEFAYLLGRSQGSLEPTVVRFATTTTTQGTLGTGVTEPKIYSFDILDGGQSRKNSKMDVGNTITFYIDAFYQEGWDRVEIYIQCWYDMGAVGSGSAPPDPPGDLDRNTYFNLTYSGGTTGATTGSWTLDWPTPLYPGWPMEVSIDSYYESLDYPGDGYEHHILQVNVTLGYQLVATTETGFTDSGDSTPDVGLDDANTWDVHVHAWDNTAPSAVDDLYTEFGIYKYTSISTSRTPSGSAPPGSTWFRLYPANVLNVSANYDYAVAVKVTDLTTVGGDTINATNIGIHNPYAWWAGADMADAQAEPFLQMPGGNMPVYVWGKWGPTYLSSPYMSTWALGYHPGAYAPPETYVNSYDPDVGLNLTYDLPHAAVTTGGTSNALDPGTVEAYMDMDDDLTVSPGDIRVTDVGAYPSGSTVQAGDTDVGTPLETWYHARLLGTDDRWDPVLETVYEDVDGDHKVSSSDIRASPFRGLTPLEWWVNIPAGAKEGDYTATVTFSIIHP
ncbi:MAG: hypothetical protein J7L61_01340, partial [Thermoplasmata archaeon]|nr:hypothetical protein [Thermoplasmata archaeon]